MFDETGHQVIWNSTTLDPAKDCPRKYFYMVIEGWQPKGPFNDNITFGSYYAKGLERFHRYRADNRPYDDAFNQVIKDTLEATLEWKTDNTVKNRETLIRSLVWYLEQYRDDPCKTVILTDGTPAVELTFQFNLTDNIVLAGHLDRIIEYSGDYYIQDQKSTGSALGKYYFNRYNPDNQMSLYTIAAEVVWKTPVKGVMIDAAEIKVGFTRFERGFTFRTKAQNEEWLRHAEYHIRRIWEAQDAGYPMNDSACMKYGGCQYMEVCSKSPEVREEFLRAKFERRPIDVLGERH